MNFDFFNPWMLLFLLLIPYLVWMVRRSIADLTRRRTKALVGLRVAVIVLLAVALTHVMLASSDESGPVATIFCVDASDSIADDTLASAAAFIQQSLDTRAGDDRGGMVVFGGEAELAGAPWESPQLLRPKRPADAGSTDIASAIRLALLALPEDTERRIVLLSDGRQTRHDHAADVLAVAADAAARGVRVDTVALSSGRTGDVVLSDLVVPAAVKESQPFDVGVRLAGAASGESTVKLYVDDMTKPVGEQKITIAPGKEVVTFPVQIAEEGSHVIRAVVENASDPFARNNAATGIIQVGPKPRVLIVAQDTEDAKYLTTALINQAFEVPRVTPPDRFPKYPAGGSREQIRAAMKMLLGFDVIVLANVPAKSLTREQMLLINSYVYDFGGGLVMVGGKSSFGSGGYYKTPIEMALPVYTDPLREAPVFAVVLIMDKSWSMGDSQKADVRKIDVIKESVIAAIEGLTKKDFLCVVSFDTDVHTILDMQRVENIPGMVKEISTMDSFGLTNFYPALVEAKKILGKKTVADYKHAILLSDGRPSGSGKDYEGQLTKMKKDRIVVSTIAVGVDADKKLMNNIAAWGKGQYYYTREIDAIPQIILKEMGRIKELLLVEGNFKPRLGPNPHSPILKGIGVAGMPGLLGFNRSRPKETAQVGLIVSAKDEPLLASWRYGAGSAVAFLSDARDIWAQPWIANWEQGFGRFWRQVVLGTVQMRRGEIDYHLTLDREGARLRLALDVADREGRYVSGARLTAEVLTVTPNASEISPVAEALELKEVAPGRYAATVTMHRDQPVLVRVKRPSGEEAFVHGGIAAAPAEYLTTGTDETLLENIRKTTGGKAVKPEEVFVRTKTQKTELTQIDYALLLAATILFAVDIFVRRMPAVMRFFSGRQEAV